MKLMNKITIFIVSFVVVIIGLGSIFWNHYYQESNALIIEDTFNSRKIHIKEFISGIKDDLELQLYDYAVWDDIYYNIIDGNFEWLKNNATYFLYEDEAYDIDLIYVTTFDETYVEFYCDNVEIEDFKSSRYWLDVIKDKDIYTSFEKIDGQVYLLSTSKIYNNNRDKSIGYYTMGKLIDDDFFNKFKILNFEYANLVTLGSNTISYQMINNTLQMYYPLSINDHFGLELHVDMTYALKGNNNIFEKMAYHIIVFFLVTMLLLYFLLKGFNQDLNGVIRSINAIIEGDYSVSINNKKFKEIDLLSKKTNQLAQTIENKIDELEMHQLDTLQVIIQTIEEKDLYTRGHSERVSRYASFLAENANCSSQQIDTIVQSAVVHDIGKIGIKDSILNKPGKLTEEEYKEIMTHSERGYKILCNSRYFKPIIDIVKYHHERYDGKGYPEGLKGAKIPRTSRILALADTLDAMTSDRPYRKGLDFHTAITLIEKEKGKQFDPLLTDIFINSKEDLYKIYKSFN